MLPSADAGLATASNSSEGIFAVSEMCSGETAPKVSHPAAGLRSARAGCCAVVEIGALYAALVSI